MMLRRRDTAGKSSMVAVGAAVTLGYRGQALAEQLGGCVPTGLDVIWNTSGHHDFALATRAAAAGCRVLITAAVAGQMVPLPGLHHPQREPARLGHRQATVADLAVALINRMLRAC